jgi:hypothetical protein
MRYERRSTGTDEPATGYRRDRRRLYLDKMTTRMPKAELRLACSFLNCGVILMTGMLAAQEAVPSVLALVAYATVRST